MRGFESFSPASRSACWRSPRSARWHTGSPTGSRRQGREILGADESFSLIQREANPAERAFLAAHGDVAVVATLRGMVRGAEGKTALAEVKAVDGAYPLYGRVVTEPPGDIASLLERRGDVFGGIVDPELLKRLGLVPGARVTLGAATIELRATLTSEPDKLAGGLGVRPAPHHRRGGAARVRAAAARQPGALDLSAAPAACGVERCRRQGGGRCRQCGAARGRLRDPQPQQCRAAARAQHRALLAISHAGRPHRAAGRRRRGRQFRQALSRRQAIGDRHHEIARRHRDDGGRHLFRRSAAARRDRDRDRARARRRAAVRRRRGVRAHVLPLPLAPGPYPGQLGLALAYGVLTTATFALWPLGRAHDMPVSALFRDEVAPRAPYAAPALCGRDDPRGERRSPPSPSPPRTTAGSRSCSS